MTETRDHCETILFIIAFKRGCATVRRRLNRFISDFQIAFKLVRYNT